MAQETVPTALLDTIYQACVKVIEDAYHEPNWSKQINQILDSKGQREESNSGLIYQLDEPGADGHRWLWETDSLGNKIGEGKDGGVNKSSSVGGLYAPFWPNCRSRFQLTRLPSAVPGQIVIDCRPVNKKEKEGFTGTFVTDSTGMPIRIEGSDNDSPPMTSDMRSLWEYSRGPDGIARLQRGESWGKLKVVFYKKSFHSVVTYLPYPQEKADAH